MKNYLIVLFVFFLTSCGNQQQNQNQSTEMSDSMRLKLLQEKKQRLDQGKSNGKNVNIDSINWSNIRFTPFIPPYPELGNEGVALLETKITAIISKFGVSSDVSNP